jgi:leucyl-tRNA synthetase
MEDAPDSQMAFQDRVFESAVNRAIVEADRAYGRTMYREALVQCFFAMNAARDWYRSVAELISAKMKKSLVLKFILAQAVMLSPIAPHFADHVWRNVLHKEGFIWSHGRWPVAGPIDTLVLAQNDFLEETLSRMRIAIRDYCDPSKAAKRAKHTTGGSAPAPAAAAAITPPTEAVITVARGFPEWTVRTYTVLNELFDKNGGKGLPEIKAIVVELNKDKYFAANKHTLKKAMSKVDTVQQALNAELAKRALGGASPSPSSSSSAATAAAARPDALTLGLKFPEKDLLVERLPYIVKALHLNVVKIEEVDGDEKVLPGFPGFTITK